MNMYIYSICKIMLSLGNIIVIVIAILVIYLAGGWKHTWSYHETSGAETGPIQITVLPPQAV